MMSKSTLFESNLDLLRETCGVLSTLSETIFPNESTAYRLSSFVSLLPQPPTYEQEGTYKPSLMDAINLVEAARTSANLIFASDQATGKHKELQMEFYQTLDDLQSLIAKKQRYVKQDSVHGLYVIIDPAVTGGRDPIEITREALTGGARVIQLRDKINGKSKSLSLAKSMKSLCDEKGGLFIVNDHADLAASIEASGLHIGQEDLPVDSARLVLDQTQIIGRSNHNLQEAIQSQIQGVDYLAIGAMYPTTSKDQPIIGGIHLLEKVRESVKTPLVVIGGITHKNLSGLIKSGADAICVIGAVGLAANPLTAAQLLVESIHKAGGRV